MPVITPQIARELAAKSHEARRRNNELRILAAQEPQPEPQLPQNPISEELSRTQAQIDELNEQLDQCDDFRAWDALTRAKERLFRIWAHLAGIPGPGNLKPSAKATPRRTVSPVGVEPAPSPTPAPQNEAGS